MDELAAYHEGTLPSDARERLQEHLVSCRECRSELLGFARFSDSGPPRGEADLSNRDVEGLWQRMQPHLEGDGYEDPFRGPADETPVPQPGVPRIPAPIVHPIPQRTNAQGRRTSYALAATLLVGVVGLGFWNVSLQRQLRAAREIQLNPPIAQKTIQLEEVVEPAPGTQRDAETVSEERLSQKEENSLFLRLPKDGVRFNSYRVVVERVGEGGVEIDSLIEPLDTAEGKDFELRIFPGRLKTGRYEIRIFAMDEGPPGVVVASGRIRMTD